MRLIFDRLSDDALLDDAQLGQLAGRAAMTIKRWPGTANPAVRVAERRPEVQGRRHQAVAAGDPCGSLARSSRASKEVHATMPRKKTAADGLSAEGAPWLDGRAIEIAGKHLAAVNEEPNGEWPVGDNCGLIMHPKGCWHDFLNEKTGHRALSSVRSLAPWRGGNRA